jgi:hypothetical protein
MYSPPSGLRYASSEVSQPLCNDFGSSINSRHVAGEAERHHHGLRGSDAWLRVYGPARGPVCKLMRCMPMNQVKRSRLLPALVLGSWECLRGPLVWTVQNYGSSSRSRIGPNSQRRAAKALTSRSVAVRRDGKAVRGTQSSLRPWASAPGKPRRSRSRSRSRRVRGRAGVRLLRFCARSQTAQHNVRGRVSGYFTDAAGAQWRGAEHSESAPPATNEHDCRLPAGTHHHVTGRWADRDAASAAPRRAGRHEAAAAARAAETARDVSMHLLVWSRRRPASPPVRMRAARSVGQTGSSGSDECWLKASRELEIVLSETREPHVHTTNPRQFMDVSTRTCKSEPPPFHGSVGPHAT